MSKVSVTSEEILKGICPYLVSKEILSEMDPDVVATPLSEYAPEVAGETDLCVVYKISAHGGTSRYPITRADLENYGIGEESLYEAAKRREGSGVTAVCGMFNTMQAVYENGMPQEGSFLQPEEEVPDDMLIILSNEDGTLGNIRILDKPVLERIYAKHGLFYILPSSIHECLAFIPPKDDNRTPGEFASMVSEINACEVRPEERMSNNIYKFDGNKIQQVMTGSAAT